MKLIVDTKSEIYSIVRNYYTNSTRDLYQNVASSIIQIDNLYNVSPNRVTQSALEQTETSRFYDIDKLNEYSDCFNQEDQQHLKDHYALYVNGLSILLKKPSLNIVASEFSQEREELPVYSFFAKPLVDYFPAQHSYTTQSNELYAKNMALHCYDIKRVNKSKLVESKLYDEVDKLSVLSTFLFDESLAIEADVIQLKSFSSGKIFDYSKTTYTQAKFKNKQCLMPVIVPAELYDFETKENKKIFFYTFLFNSDPQKIKRYKKARVYFNKVLDSLMRYEGAYFYDLQKYNKLYYASALKRFVDPEKANLYEEIKKFNISINTDISSPQDLIDATSTYAYPENLLRKKAKYKKNKEDAYVSLQNSYQTFVDINREILEVRNQKRYLQTKLDELKRAEESLKQKSQNLHQSYSQLPGIISSLKTNILKHSQSNRATLNLQDLFLQYQTEENKQPNKTLENLLSSYEFVDLSFTNTKSGLEYSFAKDSEKAKTTLTADPKYKDNYTLNQIQLRTKEPTPIRVDGSDVNVKVGGPYEILCTRNNLLIRPLSIDSYYVIDNINSTRANIIVHPHANHMNVNSQNQTNARWSNACLGEASTLIYKAFEDWDISRLIIAINLWLTSANSSDVWGRRYTHFENWSDHLAYKEHLASIENQLSATESITENSVQLLEINETQNSHRVALVEPSPQEEIEPPVDAPASHEEESYNLNYTPYITTL